MKILHIGKYYPPALGGIEYFLQDLVQEQVKTGHQIKVLCHQHFAGKAELTVKNSVEIYRAASWGTLAYAPVSPMFGRGLSRLTRSFAPSIIHVHMPNLSAFWVLHFCQNTPIVLHWHSDVITSNRQMKLRLLYPGYRFFEQRLLKKAKNIIVTSEEYLKHSRPLEKYKDKCKIIPLGVSLDRLKTETDEYANAYTGINNCRFADKKHQGFKDYDFTVLSVGRFTYYKGFEYLIQAARYLPKTRFIVVGDGPLRHKLQKLCQKIGVADRVSLPGKLNDGQLAEIIKGSDVFCLPSIEKTEAFGLVLLEAMAYGKALITTNVQGSGMNEVNIHGHTGLVVPPESIQGLVRGLQNILSKSELRNWLGVNSRKRLLEKFLISNVANQIDKVYFSCLA